MKIQHELKDSADPSSDKRLAQDKRSNRYLASDSKVLKERLSDARRQARLADQERRAADERARQLEEEANELRRRMEKYAGEPQGAQNVDAEQLNTLRAELEQVRAEAEGDVDKLRHELARAQASLAADTADAEEKSRLEADVEKLIKSLAKREGELGNLRDEAAQAESRRRAADDALKQAETRRRESEEARRQAEAKHREVEEARKEAEESRTKAEEARQNAEEARRAAEIVVNELRQEIEAENAQQLSEEKAARSRELARRSRERSPVKAVVIGVFLGILLVVSSLYLYLLVNGQGRELFEAMQQVVHKTRTGLDGGVKITPMDQVEAKPSPGDAKGLQSAALKQALPRAPAQVAKLPPEPAVAKPPPKPAVARPVPKPAVAATTKPAEVPQFRKVVQRDQLPGGAWGPRMIRIPGARFVMGSHQGALFPHEEPPHHVQLSTFYISETEISFDDYDRFAAATGRSMPADEDWGRGRQPVINVTWDEARAYTNWLSQQTGKRYRLPTEAEWEYAAAGASEGFYWWGYKLGYNNAVCFNCGSEWDALQPAPVKSLASNAYGLYNTAGNVMEWVADCYHGNYEGAPEDGSAWVEPDCAFRVARGGAFNRPAEKMRTTSRTQHDPNVRLNMLGFRVVREP